ncbi:acetyltransferase [Nocardia jiangxiensis]|uniref:acetyltransferase n=1 Tax=Nocardia jiangxiensis TaxID=282685 RepID=UPI00030B4103|nr:acetyltransferase [Nocardia jiangxiensis]
MNTPDDLEFEHLTAAQARGRGNMVEDTYRASYVDAIASGDLFDSPFEFMRRFDSYTGPRNGDRFAYVLARVRGESAGQTWGWSLPPDAAWWRGFQPDPGLAGDFTVEDGERTFALSEIMVCAGYAGQGIARAMHDELLRSRPEGRATLLVEADNSRAYQRYIQWGWRKVGHLRPDWPDAPRFDVLLRDLAD